MSRTLFRVAHGLLGTQWGGRLLGWSPVGRGRGRKADRVGPSLAQVEAEAVRAFHLANPDLEPG